MAQKVYVSVEEVLDAAGVFDALENEAKNLTEEAKQQFQEDYNQLSQQQEIIKNYKQFKRLNKLITQKQNKLSAGEYKRKNDITRARNLIAKQNTKIDEMGGRSKIEDSFKQLLKLEPQILQHLNDYGFMSKNPITSDFVIYYYDQDGINKRLVRAQIPVRDAMNNIHINMSRGILELSAKITAQIPQTEKEIIATTTDLDDSNIIVAEADLEGIVETAALLFTDIQNQFNDLADVAQKIHLKREKDSWYDASLDVSKNNADAKKLLEDHTEKLQQYLYADNKLDNFNDMALKINRGHILEAYERLYQAHLKAQPDEPEKEYVQFLGESLGQDPWYLGGDINELQVKTFLDGENRKVASLDSLIKLCDVELSILNALINSCQSSAVASSLRERAKTYTQNYESQAKLSVNGKLKESVDKLVDSVFNKK